MRKRRLADCQTHPVDDPADGGIDLTFHPVGKGRAAARFAGEVGHLTNDGLFRIPDAFCSKCAGNAGRLRSLEPMRFCIGAAAV